MSGPRSVVTTTTSFRSAQQSDVEVPSGNVRTTRVSSAETRSGTTLRRPKRIVTNTSKAPEIATGIHVGADGYCVRCTR